MYRKNLQNMDPQVGMNGFPINYQFPNNSIYSHPFNYNQNTMTQKQTGEEDDRFIGAFAFPFLLGGVTGAALAPAFWNNPRQQYYPIPYPVPYQQIPYQQMYGPYR